MKNINYLNLFFLVINTKFLKVMIVNIKKVIICFLKDKWIIEN